MDEMKMMLPFVFLMCGMASLAVTNGEVTLRLKMLWNCSVGISARFVPPYLAALLTRTSNPMIGKL